MNRAFLKSVSNEAGTAQKDEGVSERGPLNRLEKIKDFERFSPLQPD